MNFKGTAFSEGQRICLNGTAHADRQVGGQSVELFMQTVLGRFVDTGKEFYIVVAESRGGEAFRIDPESRPVVADQDPLASAL